MQNLQYFLKTIPFVVNMGASAPPSVRLLPSRPYTGSPIGTTYEVHLFASNSPDELPKKRKMVQMSLRLLEKTPREIPPRSIITMEKRYLFSDQVLQIHARLDNGVYEENDTVNVCLQLKRSGGHGVRKAKVSLIQQVGVAMFSTGNFKNAVGGVSIIERLDPADGFHKASLSLTIAKSKGYSWIAMDETAKKDTELKWMAPSVVHATKTMFIIRVHYFVQIVLCFGMMQRDIVLKLPFLLRRSKQQLQAEEALRRSATSGKKTASAAAQTQNKSEAGKTLSADAPAKVNQEQK